MSKTLRAFQPVLFEAGVNSVGICPFHGTDDLLVFFDRDVEVLDDGTRIEAPVTLGLRFNSVVQRREARAGAVLDDEAVKIAIDFEDLTGMAALPTGNRIQPVIERPKLASDLLALGLRKMRHAAACNCFQA